MLMALKKRLPTKGQLTAVADMVPVYENCVLFVRKIHEARKRSDGEAAREWRAKADQAARQITRMYGRYECEPTPGPDQDEPAAR